MSTSTKKIMIKKRLTLLESQKKKKKNISKRISNVKSTSKIIKIIFISERINDKGDPIRCLLNLKCSELKLSKRRRITFKKRILKITVCVWSMGPIMCGFGLINLN